MSAQVLLALQRHRDTLLRKKNVVGCGLGYKYIQGRPTTTKALLVLVTQKQPLSGLSKHDHVPRLLDQVSTDVVAVGYVRPLGLRTACWRPVVPGISIGHYKVSAGTLGAIVYDNTSGKPLLLSNNHVLANASNDTADKATVGDPVWQPGSYDGGTKADTIAHLYRYEPLQFTVPSPGSAQAAGTPAAASRPQSSTVFSQATPAAPVNTIDAALAAPIRPHITDANVLGIGSVIGLTPVQAGDTVWKSGRTTGVTHGNVIATEVTVTVRFDAERSALFEQQIVTSPMAQPGDSGSLGMRGNGKAFGLLFAGSEQATIFNDVHRVAQQLRVRFIR